MKNCVFSVSALMLCAGLASGEPNADELKPPVAVWPADLEYDPSLIDLSEPQTPEWVERLRNNRGEPDCDLLGDPNSFDYVVRLTTWPGLVPDRIIYIDASAPLGGDGSSWQNAYQSLHDALNTESFETELVDIRIAQGLYRADRVNGVDTLDPDLTYELPGITVANGVPTGVMRIAGGFAGRDAKNPDERDLELFPTVFTGDLLGNDTDQHENYEDNTKVMFAPGLTELNGITIEHGRVAVHEGRWITDCTVRWCSAGIIDVSLPATLRSPVHAMNARVVGTSFLNNKGDRYGGALQPDGSMMVVANCWFIGNSAPTGGAIGSNYVGNFEDTLVVQNCFFGSNVSDSERGGYGGAVFHDTIEQRYTQIVHCTFAGNETVDGYGISTVAALNSVTSMNCIYDQNFSYNGAGIEAELDCVFIANTPQNLSQIAGNVFRRYNENLIDNPQHPGFRLNREAVAGFTDLFGPDGEFGTPDDDPSLGEGSESIGHSVLPPNFNQAQAYELGLFDIADLDGDCDRTEPIPVDIFGNPRAFESTPGEGVEGYPADAGCAEFIPDASGLAAQDWIVPDRSIVDFSEDPIRLFVDIDAVPGGDGSSWASAMTDPADALAIAASRIGPVEIWVAEGHYAAPVSESNVGAFQITENAALLGGFAGTETAAGQRDPENRITVLTGDVLGNDDLNDPQTLEDNTRQVVVSIGRRGGGLVDGFTLRGGNPTTAFFGAGIFSFDGWQSDRTAGIVFGGSGSLTLRNCTIGPTPYIFNSVTFEQRPMFDLDGQMSNLILENCLVTSDEATLVTFDLDRGPKRLRPATYWGELEFRDSTVDFPGSALLFSADWSGGVRLARSSIKVEGLWNTNGSFDFSQSLKIIDSEIAVGSLNLRTFSTPLEIRGTTVLSGSALGVASVGPGRRSMNLHNSVFATNGSFSTFIPSDLNNTAISGNTFPIVSPDSLAQFGPTNTIFDFDSNAADFFLDPLGPDGEPSTGDEDLRLAPGSPAINTGLNAFVDSDFDLDGNDRIIAHVVDRGAYEFTGTCTGDVNGDGTINLGDLNMVLSSFGQELPFGDASGDGAVDLADLNIVLASFGTSCDG